MNTLTAPRTNMEVAEMINQQQDDPYFSKDIHDYLLSKGGKYKQHRHNVYEYAFEINEETVRLLFTKGFVRIQVLWKDQNPDGTTEETWLPLEMFSIPTGFDVLPKFKQILNAYIEEL